MNREQIATLAVTVGVLVLVVKLLAFFVSNSVALLSDALESIVNIVASAIMLAAVAVASKPNDAAHEYGHQRAENISALVESVLIIVIAVTILYSAVERLLQPVPFGDVDLGIVLSLASALIVAALATFMLRESRKKGSIAIEGDAKHMYSDVASSIGVAAGLFIASVTGFYILDPLIAFAVVALLIRIGIDLFRRTSMDLMDTRLKEKEKIIAGILVQHKGVLGYHDLKTRGSGNTVYMEVHLCVSGNISLSEAHNMAEEVEKELRLAVPSIVPTIHMEEQDRCVAPRMLL